MQAWWKGGHPKEQTSVPFAVHCSCGKVITGQRRKMHQVINCPDCREELFVLPASPLPSPSMDPSSSSLFVSPTSSRVMFWVNWAILILLFAIAVALALTLWLFPNYQGNREFPEIQAGDIPRLLKEADSLCERNLLHLAEKKLRRAMQLQERHQSLLAKDKTILVQKHQKVKLMVDLLEEPLEVLLEHAIRLPKDEWKAVFESRYQNRSVVFDMKIRRRADGRITCDYFLQVRDEPVRLNLQNISVLENVVGEEPERVIIGLRLAAIQREQPGRWLIRFQDEGVLFHPREPLIRTLIP